MKTKCQVCMHQCNLDEGQVGRCRGRKNIDGAIICDNYGKITSMALDPIEKKPLKYYYPGTKILSVGSYGCNLSCDFCQNYSISMVGEAEIEWFYVSPEELCEEAVRLKLQNNIGVAFTYNEPLLSYEYIRDCSKLLKKQNLKTIIVTNGCFSQSTALEIVPYVDAMNIDLKGFTKEYYEKLGGSLETVLAFIETAHKWCHIELTTLIIPEENDSIEEMIKLAKWIASINPEIPLHISRFFPAWKMKSKNPTDVKRIYELVTTAQNWLKYVEAGNC